MALTNQTPLSWEKKKWKSSLWKLRAHSISTNLLYCNINGSSCLATKPAPGAHRECSLIKCYCSRLRQILLRGNCKCQSIQRVEFLVTSRQPSCTVNETVQTDLLVTDQAYTCSIAPPCITADIHVRMISMSVHFQN